MINTWDTRTVLITALQELARLQKDFPMRPDTPLSLFEAQQRAAEAELLRRLMRGDTFVMHRDRAGEVEGGQS